MDAIDFCYKFLLHIHVRESIICYLSDELIHIYIWLDPAFSQLFPVPISNTIYVLVFNNEKTSIGQWLFSVLLNITMLRFFVLYL
jgi:hypothetical protein